MSSLNAVAVMSLRRYGAGCHCATPVATARVAVARMPIRMAARTRQASRAAIRIKPKIASAVFGSRRFPSATAVAGLVTMMPELRRPMNAMNKPTPAATAAYSSFGIADTINCLTPMTVRIKNATPDRNTAPRATCQGTPMPLHDRVGEIGVQAHAWRQRDRISGNAAHQEASQRGRKAGSGGYGAERHSGFMKNRRIDEDDVSHRHERGEPGQNLSLPICAQGTEIEVLFQL